MMTSLSQPGVVSRKAYLRSARVPEADGPVSPTGEEEAGVQPVPAHAVHGHVVAQVGLEVARVMGGGALVDAPLLCPHHKQMVLALHALAGVVRPPPHAVRMAVEKRGLMGTGAGVRKKKPPLEMLPPILCQIAGGFWTFQSDQYQR